MTKRRPPKGSLTKAKQNSAYWKRQADLLWGKAIHAMYDRCACEAAGGCSGPLEAHHLISRKWGGHRHMIENGILLCHTHHLRSPACSAHMGPLGFAAFLQENIPDQWEWYYDHKHKIEKYNYRESVTHLEGVLELIGHGMKPVWHNGLICFE